MVLRTPSWRGDELRVEDFHASLLCFSFFIASLCLCVCVCVMLVCLRGRGLGLDVTRYGVSHHSQQAAASSFPGRVAQQQQEAFSSDRMGGRT